MREDFLGGDAAVHDPDAVGFAVLLFYPGEEVFEGSFIQRISWQDFVGEGEAFGGDDERYDNLDAVTALVPAVAEAAQTIAFFRRITFKIGAGQIVKQDFVFCLEEVAPASGEVVEEGAFMGQEFVVAGVEAVGIGQGEVAAQQVGDGAVVKPMPVQPPLGAGVDQAIERQGLQHQIPAGPLAPLRQMFAPEGVQAELLPEFASQPAGPPLAGAAQGHGAEPEADHRQGVVRAGCRGQIVRKERHLLRCGIVLAEKIDGLAPGRFLTAIEFPEVKHMPLEHPAVVQTPVLDHTPVEVFFAIFATFGATQEHDGCRR